MNLIPSVFGQVNALDFGRNFRAAEQQFDWSNVVLVAVIFAAVGLAIWLAVHYATNAERRGFRSPRKLFIELCHAHHLDRHSRSLLARLAAAHGVAPALLFLSPERFDAGQLNATWSTHRPELEQLRDKIFGRTLPETIVS